VSRNNRLIERHESGSVVYWKSYDFAENTGVQNLFARPLGPGRADSHFRHDGGELIFNLPNGLQAYMLVDGTGRRIDKGPTAIVSDPKRPDRAVVNGLSCMSCHARGLIDKADQVRDHVLRNADSFARADRDTILALYPPRPRFVELLERDARRFQDAVAQTGAPLSATEPVAALAARFEAELDLSLTAAEASVRPEGLLAALEQEPRLAKELGPLRVPGGTIQRQVFVAVFPELVSTLRLGTIVDPKERVLARLVLLGADQARAGNAAAARRAYTQALELDPECATLWVRRGDLARQEGNLDGAIADYDRAIVLDGTLAVAFNNRGLARQGQGDVTRAIADFSRAIELAPDLASAHHNRAAAHFARGAHDKCIVDYGNAIRLAPSSALSFNNRGLAHFKQGSLDKALADYDEAIRLAPAFAVAYYNRGLVRNQQKQFARAVADFDEAIRLEPKFARAFLSRGLAFEKQGDLARARADRARARALDGSLASEP
ncbi:MAG: tetratricopeptide repeat protein, partial [Gemmataceae bacterium]